MASSTTDPFTGCCSGPEEEHGGVHLKESRRKTNSCTTLCGHVSSRTARCRAGWGGTPLLSRFGLLACFVSDPPLGAGHGRVAPGLSCRVRQYSTMVAPG